MTTLLPLPLLEGWGHLWPEQATVERRQLVGEWPVGKTYPEEKGASFE